MTEPTAKTLPTRVLSVDLARGLTIAAMILVNDPGDYQEIYPPLQHAEWNGYTPADLIFPNFLFLSGASLVFSLAGRIGRGHSRVELLRGIGRRGVNLMALKAFVALTPTFRLRRIRIYGVLFRTALLSVLGGSTLLLTLSVPRLLGITATLLAGYAAALGVPFAGLNRPLLDPDNNTAAALDRHIAAFFQRHLHTGTLYNITHDPEGLLSSVPALGTVLLGAVAALVLRDARLSGPARRNVLALAGVVCLLSGTAWGKRLPINKNLWTSSFVLVSAGWSMLLLAGLYGLYDLPGERAVGPVRRTLARPFQIFGSNALVAYALSVLGHKIARTIHVNRDGHSLSLRTLAYRKTFARSGSSPARSLAFAASYAALCFLPNLLLWRRKIFVKI